MGRNPSLRLKHMVFHPWTWPALFLVTRGCLHTGNVDLGAFTKLSHNQIQYLARIAIISF